MTMIVESTPTGAQVLIEFAPNSVMARSTSGARLCLDCAQTVPGPVPETVPGDYPIRASLAPR